ncbi:MAG TPA: GxGYxYP family putative glycoside hydrolase [Candidatus Latescibacteria bacterium]|nr:GxGYxYP family putative glycoside hydrolase [Candidatus Latescibacterota bacterium]
MQLTDVFPSIPPVQRLTVASIDPKNEGIDFWIWFRSLQGLVNRKEPHLYVIDLKALEVHKPLGAAEKHWLDYYTTRFGIATEDVNSIDILLERYKDLAEGYVLYDNEQIIQTQNLAITRAGLENLLPVSPDQEHWMQRHGIPKRDDLRRRFSDDWDAAEWAIEHLWPSCYRKIYGNFCIHRPNWYAYGHQLEDFIVMHRGMALDLPRCRTHRRSLYLYRKMMESADPPGCQMNWHCAWEQEKEYVAEAAQKGFFVLCSTGTPNLSIHGGIGDPNKSYAQPLPARESCEAEKEKVYVCFYNSDGDATWAMNNLHSGNWLVPQRGKFKFGWGFLPLMVKLMPGMLQYYQETKTEADCFWGPSSGAAYTYTHKWPTDLVDMYLTESRKLLDQTGQNGCNLVNWFLQDWWREVEDEKAVRREQEAMASGPGLVCGLGGSPFAKSYLAGPIPKVHSVHIANVGRDNVGDIVRFSRECPTRPLFMFLFAQISVGIWEQIESELEEYKKHPEIEILSMDQFFLTLQDAIQKGLVKDRLYETTQALEETWLRAPGRHRLPLCERLANELREVAAMSSEARRKHIADAAWTDLVSIEIEGVARDREAFLKRFKGRKPPDPSEDADALLYVAFTTAWVVVRAAIEAQGIYANHRTQCLTDFRRTCGHFVDVGPFERLFTAWENWENGVPDVETIRGWCAGIATASRQLTDTLGPGETEEFSGWPPRAI